MTEAPDKLYRELFSQHDPSLLKIWQAATIGIAGCGGLGSNIALSLCRAGIGHLIIVDFDVVTVPNLNRQQFTLAQVGQYKAEAMRDNLAAINPFCSVTVHLAKINSDNVETLFGECDILMEALDGAEQKQMLIETWLNLHPERPLIGASGIAGYGNNELIHVVKSDNLFICGDEISEPEPGLSPLAPRVAIVANLQANLCLELLVKRNKTV